MSIPPKEVFISHSSRNNGFVQQMHRTLAAHEVPSFLSGQRIKSGDNWLTEIGKALERCDWFLLVLSEQAVKSTWVRREYVAALQRPQYENALIPIKYRKHPPDPAFWTVSQNQAISFLRNREAGFKKLLARWGIVFDPAKLT